MKWNFVVRIRSDMGIAAGEYRFRLFVAVGSLEDVRQALGSLESEFARR